ncbi:FGGY-family carbohydrate kinase [Alteraurantiacibacter buctensis]|uniref:Carbohydrate kinase n=1 Tax=Alteraurantiacibacter buctensis TaxID=1503981 RepID=A0A844YYP9_9SPHN|nr:carbohydrate kinase [Alteraurantiacibacter buctensis]MXO71911.1 carbohydrate kinase [Alteraurantiacibacter buctensis]
MISGFAIVVDVGKTLTKVSLWSREGRLLQRATRPGSSLVIDGHRHLDAPAIGEFVLDAIAGMDAAEVRYLVPVAHGAGVAAIRGDTLAVLPLDYEQPLQGDILAEYRLQRAPFAETGSPALPGGLNFGAQLFWLDRKMPTAMHGATLLPWAQYWAWFLSGAAASEATSLGCHSDLWNPAQGRFSSLAEQQGWAGRFAPLARAGEAIGTVRPDIAKRCGLPASCQVLAGLHDSNAALIAARGFPEIAGGEATVLSTGTWFVAMRSGAGILPDLPEERDCLVNVDAFGQPVPSARFMGGREIELLVEIDTRRVDIVPDQPRMLASVPGIVAQGSMVLPTLTPGCGPFPVAQGGWHNRPDDWFARRAGACLYAALVADTALDLIGARDTLLIEGRFAEAQVLVRAVAALRPEMQVYTANAHTDVSFGALRLIDPDLAPEGTLNAVEPLPIALEQYRTEWTGRISA